VNELYDLNYALISAIDSYVLGLKNKRSHLTEKPEGFTTLVPLIGI
jgi:hypothetical protein